MQEKTFPNGFTSWAETHFEVVQFISSQEEGFINNGTKIEQIRTDLGTGGLYELAEKWTDEFENKYKGKEWSGEYFDAIDEFLTNKNNNNKN
jgi:hypothetical protein